MLRNVITFARSHGLGSILPLDEHIYFHKMAGMFTFIYSLTHTFAHLCNLGERQGTSNRTTHSNVADMLI